MTTRNEPAAPQNGVLDTNGTFIDSEEMGGVGITKLEALAMQIYVKNMDSDYTGVVKNAEMAITAANVFFDQLEKGK